MRYLSLFSGIGGFDLGFDRAGMECAGQVEIDTACNTLLARYWPDVWRCDDVRKVGSGNAPAVDLVCGGFPCQDVSVAGRRAGLAGERSGLWFEFRRILADIRPAWAVIENVPGLLSSNGGRDFSAILHGLGELGYLAAWRVLDAQYFGVAQRRRRVFIVASLGDGRCAQVLFERQGVYGDSPPRREAGQDVAAPVSASTPSRRNGGSCPAPGTMIPDPLTFDWAAAASTDEVVDRPGATRGLSASRTLAVAFPLTARPSRLCNEDNYVAHTLRASGCDGSEDGTGRGVPMVCAALTGNPYADNESRESLLHSVASGVRRLTPTECCRLQGFPDDWNTYGIDDKGNRVVFSDSARYRQLGNAVCVPVIEWLGQRIMEASQ